MAEADIADLLMWLEPQHLPFLNLFNSHKETRHDAPEAPKHADAKDESEAASAS